MVNIIVSLVIVLLSSCEWTQAKDNCNDACLTKSYSITRDGAIGCSGANCLMEASFKAHRVNSETVFNINIVGYDLSSTSEQGTFSVILTHGKSQTEYSCFTTYFGSAGASVSNDGVFYVNGSTQINQNNLYCSWYMVYSSDIWPAVDDVKATFESDKDWKISFQVDDKTYNIAPNPVELPIYRMQFLKCCYRVFGNDIYQLIIDQNDKQTDFFMQTSSSLQSSSSNNNSLTATLTDAAGTQLIFNCYFTIKSIVSYLRTQVYTDISNQLFSPFVDETQCSWSLPLIVENSSSKYDTTNGVYDLNIFFDDDIVYTEPNVHLKGFASKMIANLLLIITAFVMHFFVLN